MPDELRPYQNYRRRGYVPPDEPWWGTVPPPLRWARREGAGNRATWWIEQSELDRLIATAREEQAMNQGAIEMVWGDGRRQYVVLPIHEYRNDGARFRLHDPQQRGSHLLSARDVRANWNSWVGELVRDDQIVDAPPAGVEVY